MDGVEYIFVISPGRSGTSYISKLFENAIDSNNEAVLSEHEPFPVCCGQPMIDWNFGDTIAMKELTMLKKDLIDQKRGRRVYFESNPQFIKGFGWEWLKATEISQQKKSKIKFKILNSHKFIYV